MPKVLIVEDNNLYFKAIKRLLEDRGIEVLRAATLEEGETLFFTNSADIDLIMMDACINSNEPNSMSLVAKILEAGFEKPILACSADDSHGQKLVKAGATHNPGKIDAAKMALKLLGLIF
ncbi:MAG: response regulator [bacterium]